MSDASSISSSPTRPSTQPNIVVFYLDDTNPTDGRLWSDPMLTPNLYDLFVAHGINLRNAFGETPLCCPSRATLLTGLHTLNHGVVRNDARLFDPQENVAKELLASGYQTMLIGKYLNKPELLTPDQWTQTASDWTQFDAISSAEGATYHYYYDYSLYTKQGTLNFGEQPQDHSTRVIGTRAVERLQEADRGDPKKPIFQLLSIFNTHDPNIPMPGLENDPRWQRCASMPAWDPPNYNEADVSDKPGYVQSLPLLPYPDGWPMGGLCREMLGVDWLVGQVVDELKADGRFDNTLFMFTADNGMNWGQHRLAKKQTPYATRVPLYFSWQAQWGPEPKTIDEYVSDIDFAPTFCDLAGCTLGPYPDGQSKPDGVSLLPLLDGSVSNLGRDALLEDNFASHLWAGVRTTPESSLGLWHYVTQPTGFIELYNDASDPWELNNVASDPGNSNLIATLKQRMYQLMAEGRPDKPGTVTIIENSKPNSGTDFAYTGDLGSFSLDDDSNSTLPRKKVFTNVATGAYKVTQAKPSGWTLTGISCPVEVEIDKAGLSATLHVLPSDNIVCTFTNTRHQPDASISLTETGTYKGDNVYSTVAGRTQTVTRSGVAAGAEYDYWVKIENDGPSAEPLTVKATVTNPATMSARFESAGVDVTSAVTAGTYTTPSLATGASRTLLLRVTVAPNAVVGDKSVVVVNAISSVDPSGLDVVRAVTAR